MSPAGNAKKEGVLQVSDHTLAAILAPLSLLIILVTSAMLYSTGKLPPPKIPSRAVMETVALAKKPTSSDEYSRVVRQDAKEWGIDRDDVKTDLLRQANAHFVDFSGDMALARKKMFETTHLKLKTSLEKISVGEEGMELRTDHIVLRIENRTNKYLAYRVRTAVEGKCGNKAVLGHNAMALKPGEILSRTECLPKGPGTLRILKVEVVQLSQLGYYYISRINPEQLFMDPRTTEGHQIPQDKACKMLPWRAIHQAVKQGGARWRDVIDFYARHNCDKYFFYPSYRYSESGLTKLPARAEQAPGSRRVPARQ